MLGQFLKSINIGVRNKKLMRIKKNEYKSNVITCPNTETIVMYNDKMRKSAICHTLRYIRMKRLMVSREGRNKTKRTIRIKQSKRRQRIKVRKMFMHSRNKILRVVVMVV